MPSNAPLRMYGNVSSGSQLAWSWVDARLTDAEIYWVDVAGSGARPHPRPVWGVWRDEAVHLSIGTPAIRRAAEPGVGATVHLDSGIDVVIVEGEVVGDTEAADVIAAYDSKYDWKYDLAQYGPLTTIRPTSVLAWRAAGPAGRDGFQHTGRWTWD
jgi:hypothetical protein